MQCELIIINNVYIVIIASCSNGQADCVDGSTCIDSLNGEQFVCLCPFGLFGDGRINGTGCVADRCTFADCTEIASCVNSPDDGFVCICPSGFKGDGRIGGSGCTGMFIIEFHKLCMHGYL